MIWDPACLSPAAHTLREDHAERGRYVVQQVIPGDSLIEWKKLSKIITCDVVIIVKASEVTAPRGRGQGKQKAPDLKTVVKPAFNKHAVREPGACRTCAAGCLRGMRRRPLEVHRSAQLQ